MSRISLPGNFKLIKSSIEAKIEISWILLSDKSNHCKFFNLLNGVISTTLFPTNSISFNILISLIASTLLISLWFNFNTSNFFNWCISCSGVSVSLLLDTFKFFNVLNANNGLISVTSFPLISIFSSLSNFESGSIFSIWFEVNFTAFKFLKFEIKSTFFSSTLSKTNSSMFVIYSRPEISVMPWFFPSTIFNDLICSRSFFVIDDSRFVLPKAFLLMNFCKFLSWIIFISSCFSTMFWYTVPLNRIWLSAESVSNLNSYTFSPVLFHLTDPLLSVPSSPCHLIFWTISPFESYIGIFISSFTTPSLKKIFCRWSLIGTLFPNSFTGLMSRISFAIKFKAYKLFNLLIGEMSEI